MTSLTRTPPKNPADQRKEISSPSSDSSEEESPNIEAGQINTLLDELKSFQPEPHSNLRNNKKVKAQLLNEQNSKMDKLVDAISLLRKDLTNEVKSLKSEVTSSSDAMKQLKSAVSGNTQKLDSLVARLDSIETSSEAVQQKLNDFDERLTGLESGVTHTSSTRITAIEEKLDDIEQVTLNSKLILTIPEPPTESRDMINESSLRCTQFVREQLVEKLRLTQTEVGTISVRQVKDSTNRFILELGDQQVRYQIFKKCKEFKPDSFYINEFLTKHRHTLMYDLRKLKDTKPRLKRIYSDHGKIFAIIDGRASPVHVAKMDDILALL